MPQPQPVSIRLTPEQIKTLEAEAARVGSLASTGPTAGEPSWRRLVSDLADGKLKVKKVK